MGERQLTVEEQHVVLSAVKLPEQVTWPNWWSVRAQTCSCRPLQSFPSTAAGTHKQTLVQLRS
jgi:hypothetical protein